MIFGLEFETECGVMSANATANEIDDFLNGALLTWVGIFSIIFSKYVIYSFIYLFNYRYSFIQIN